MTGMIEEKKDRPIRILQAMFSFYHGGAQAMIINLHKAMDRSRIQFDYIVDHEGYDGLLPTVRELGSEVYYAPAFNGHNVKEVRQTWERFFTEHPEYKIMHCHIRSYSSLFIPIAKKHGVKVIVHSHNTSSGSGIKAIASRILQYPLRYQADYCFACSKEAGQWLYGDRITEKENFYVINNAVDTSCFVFDEKIREVYRSQFEIKDNSRVYIQVGRFDRQKNYLFTISLFARHLKDHPQDRLFIIGDGDLKEEIYAGIENNGLNDKVTHLSKRNDVNCLLQMADCFLMPSLWEGLSVAAVEAQASGITCLMSDQVDRNVNITGICRFLPLEEEIWLQEMNELDERKDLSCKIREAGFDIAENAQWLSNFYESIVK